MKRFVLGDIHGEVEYLKEVLEKSGIDKEKDLLIQIGDVCDRGSDPFKCMDILLEYKNLVLIVGNHDESFMYYIATGEDLMGSHTANGSKITIDKWKELSFDKKKYYIENIFNKMKYYHITDDNILFVHAGIGLEDISISEMHPSVFTWDREFIQEVMSKRYDTSYHMDTADNFKRIYLGHTPTIYWEETKPMYSGGVWNVDTGSGKGGPLTIMNIDSGEYWQSKTKIHESNEESF